MNNDVALMFAFGIAGLLMIVGVIIMLNIFLQKKGVIKELKSRILELDHRKKMLQAAFESQENERKKLSRDLRDDVGMMLMTMRVNLSNMKVGRDTDDLKKLVDEAHETIQRISADLMPATLENFGLTNSLKEMCSKLTGQGQAKVLFAESGVQGRLDKNQEMLLYRITQEAVNNSVKHAQASHIFVKMDWVNGHLDLSVSDNGHGFDISPVKQHGFSGRHGLGIYNLENRAELLGGRLEYKKNYPTGTIMSVRLQLNANELN